MTLQRLERILAAILIVGGLLHAYGSFTAFDTGSVVLAWSLGSAASMAVSRLPSRRHAAFAIFLGCVAFEASSERARVSLRRITIAGLLAWGVVVALFGSAIGNFADPRVLYHIIVAALLVLAFLFDRRAGAD